MKIVVDENIPWALEAFSAYGEVTPRPGRLLRKEDLLDAGALVVRSVTQVGPALLDGTPVRFLGTATVGMDHLDLPYIEGAGIRWASAAGSNARSVVEWVLAALAEYCVAQDVAWDRLTLGIAGCGAIGSRLARIAVALGMRVLVNDPPLVEEGRLPVEFQPLAVPLETLLEESDFVTLHVPYTREGRWATHHLIGMEQLHRMKASAVLANSSRGAVLDNAAARHFARTGLVTFILDVFENEPAPDRELVKSCFLATPHVAGYSLDGKFNGTRQIAEELGRFLGNVEPWRTELPPPEARTLRLPGASPMHCVHAALQQAYPIRKDDERLRGGLALEEDSAWAAHFDGLRKNYPVRRELPNYALAEPPGDPMLERWLVDILGAARGWHEVPITPVSGAKVADSGSNQKGKERR